jgi:predicted RNA-binding Zn-ribbon protein involved in translation (DUF1610 family)
MEWIFENKIVLENVEMEERKCSSCGQTTTAMPWELYNFCPWCGEPMIFNKEDKKDV